MEEETKIMIEQYSKNPLQNFELKKYTVKQQEGNFICWDEIVVYLEIENEIIKNYSFDGNCSNITTAAASFLSEIIINKPIKEVISRNYQTMIDNWFTVSPRRQRAATIAILATRNAIHNYLKDEKVDTFDEIIDN